MIFEWDERKRRLNLRKHGLDFAGATTVFAGRTVTVSDDRYHYEEPRYWTLGLLRERVVIVAHTETDQITRVISMRRADRREQAIYFEKIEGRQ